MQVRAFERYIPLSRDLSEFTHTLTTILPLPNRLAQKSLNAKKKQNKKEKTHIDLTCHHIDFWRHVSFVSQHAHNDQVSGLFF